MTEFPLMTAQGVEVPDPPAPPMSDMFVVVACATRNKSWTMPSRCRQVYCSREAADLAAEKLARKLSWSYVRIYRLADLEKKS